MLTLTLTLTLTRRPDGSWDGERAGGIVLNPDALLPDEPAVAAPALTLTGDTDEEDGEDV